MNHTCVILVIIEFICKFHNFPGNSRFFMDQLRPIITKTPLQVWEVLKKWLHNQNIV